MGDPGLYLNLLRTVDGLLIVRRWGLAEVSSKACGEIDDAGDDGELGSIGRSRIAVSTGQYTPQQTTGFDIENARNPKVSVVFLLYKLVRPEAAVRNNNLLTKPSPVKRSRSSSRA